VRVLVLCDDLANRARGILCTEPFEHGAERPLPWERESEAVEIGALDLTGGKDLDGVGHARRPLTKKARRQLREAVVTLAFGSLQNPTDVGVQSALTPVIAGRFLGALRLSLTSRLEQRGGRRGIVVGVVAWRKGVVPLWPASAGVLVHKGSTHRNSISWQNQDRKRVAGRGLRVVGGGSWVKRNEAGGFAVGLPYSNPQRATKTPLPTTLYRLPNSSAPHARLTVETDSFRDELQGALAPAYTIQRELTGGGMSRVFVALEHALGRTVVVKVLKPELGAGVNRERFRREIMLAAQLQHPHIVPVLNAGEHDELLWYTMPFVEGVSLRDSLAHVGKFSPRTVTRVLHDVLDALAYAHRRGVIHRDIKPGNILHHGAHSLVTDFGVAKALSASLPHSGTTSVGIAIGTPAYMAPEQLAADPSADHRLDLYAVGLLAYELLTGVQPFSGSSPQATMAAQLTRMPTPLEECCPGVPPGLAALVMRLLAKHPADRPQSADAALAELEGLTTPTGSAASSVSSASVGTAAASSGEVTAPPARSSSARSIVAIAAACAAIAAVAVITWRNAWRSDPSHVAVMESGSPKSAAAYQSLRVETPGLSHADSLRIAEAVRAQLARKGLPGGPRAVDSLRQTVTRAYADSARGSRVQATASPAPSVAARGSTTPTPGSAAAASKSRSRLTTPAAKAPIFARPRRVAIFPVRDATQRSEAAPAARAIEDSLRKALVNAGYTPATDAELLRLIAQADISAQRRMADSLGIGAMVLSTLSTRADEIVAQSIVVDVWRNYPMSDRTATDLDKPQEALGLVRNVARALERVSWRSRSDPKRVLVFDLENQTGSDSIAALAGQLSDSLRAAVVRRLGAEVVADSQARATKDATERRAVGLRLSAGAIVAGGLYRARGDSISLRLSTRDMSEDRTYPAVEVRVARADLLANFQSVADRLMADLGQVNWGPKQLR